MKPGFVQPFSGLSPSGCGGRVMSGHTISLSPQRYQEEVWIISYEGAAVAPANDVVR